jgi:hypothetical protein
MCRLFELSLIILSLKREIRVKVYNLIFCNFNWHDPITNNSTENQSWNLRKGHKEQIENKN